MIAHVRVAGMFLVAVTRYLTRSNKGGRVPGTSYVDRLASNSQKFSCLHLLRTGIAGVHHHTRSRILTFKRANISLSGLFSQFRFNYWLKGLMLASPEASIFSRDTGMENPPGCLSVLG